MFQVKKNPSKWIIAGTGSGWELIPQITDRIVFCLNDYVRIEKYGVKPDLLCIMDILDEKPQIISGSDNLGDIIAKINNMKVPLVAPFQYEEIPLSVPFPIEKCAKEFGVGAMYFSNTIAYMIAFALMNGAKDIAFYGVNQAGSHEYSEERASVEFWIGIALGRGVKVTINGKNSQLLMYKGRYGRGLLYGYLQSFEEIIHQKAKYGEPIVRRLMKPPQVHARTIRKVNS